ncbi:MAG: 3,4-dehydroadipyl-CoA semialdehyde dehydrogenase [Deltaproteobacteria bacterium]|nr:3,4-dehydroadipyl-CoA semialdehyde dehydrogenase [Deltaproteobacteria bacterium]MDQ3296737.1 3,4-dehydroadipyl-CoA semialdehyde dehydrogenase [Myxococcota bacterium]
MQLLPSYLSGSWSPGSGTRQTLVNPTTEAPLAEVSTSGHDFAAAFSHARAVGTRELGALTFAQRGALLGALAKAIHGAREELIALAVANGGNTRGDAKFDIDGGAVTLSHYADLGARLGSAPLLPDGEPIQVGRTARMAGQHVWAPRHGVAIHINAFNFPGWGLCEKLGPALLAGMPVITKPATATALVAHRLVELFAPLLPPGALQLLVGPAGTLLDHVGPGDVVAFTGGSATARTLRAHERLVAHAVRLNIEADSLNAAVLGPDIELASETGALFLADVVRDMTQKTGQKCTAIRRVLVPEARQAEIEGALRERLAGIVIGDPAREEVRMGPLATAQQLRDVREGIARLAAETTSIFGGTGEVTPVGVPAGKGFFVGPIVRATPTPLACAALNDHEVFGPVVTVGPYDGDATLAAQFVARGEGCLVSSAYSDDRDWVARFVRTAGAWAGRLYLGSSKMASQSPGPGTVLPSLTHGGPGRAGGGEELGGERGLHTYMQRVALEGDASVLKSLLA